MCTKRMWIPSKEIEVNCGTCHDCRKQKYQSWGFRLEQELLRQGNKNPTFVTLTYNDDNLPLNREGKPTLKKTDLQAFMKKIRRMNGKDKIRYYACGEYGSKKGRPHYHLLIMGLNDINYVAASWTNSNGDSRGRVDYSPVRKVAAAYYTIKYQMKPPTWKITKGQLKEFQVCSKGIGRNYLDDNGQKMYFHHVENLDQCYVRNQANHKIPMPKYYKDLIFTQDEKKIIRDHIAARMEKKIQENYQKTLQRKEYSHYTWEMFLQMLSDNKELRNIAKNKQYKPHEIEI